MIFLQKKNNLDFAHKNFLWLSKQGRKYYRKMSVPKWRRFGCVESSSSLTSLTDATAEGPLLWLVLDALLLPVGVMVILHQCKSRVVDWFVAQEQCKTSMNSEPNPCLVTELQIQGVCSQVLFAVRQQWITALQMIHCFIELRLRKRLDQCQHGWVSNAILSRQGLLKWRVKVRHQCL